MKNKITILAFLLISAASCKGTTKTDFQNNIKFKARFDLVSEQYGSLPWHLFAEDYPCCGLKGKTCSVIVDPGQSGQFNSETIKFKDKRSCSEHCLKEIHVSIYRQSDEEPISGIFPLKSVHALSEEDQDRSKRLVKGTLDKDTDQMAEQARKAWSAIHEAFAAQEKSMQCGNKKIILELKPGRNGNSIEDYNLTINGKLLVRQE